MGNISSRTISEVKNLELNQFSDGKTFWGAVSAAVEQSRLLGDMGNLASEADSRIPQKK